MPVAIKTFKMILLVEGREFVSFAESSVLKYRYVSLEGEDLGDGSHDRNLNERPPLRVDERPIEGALQFIFNELQYMKLLTEGTDLQGSMFTLLLTDSDGEQHSVDGILTGEGLHYVNP
jgi:hypothetical protein